MDSQDSRLGSIKVKFPKIQRFIAEKGREIEEDDQVVEEEEARSIAEKGKEMEEDHQVVEEEDKEASDEEEEEHGAKSMEVDVEGEEKKHMCCECGKRFKSGKALGGHKRIHGLETRKIPTVIRPKMLAGVVGRSERGELEVACCVCHKKFTSMKALYGHMRFHPDRGWKGVFPPLPHPLGNSSSSTLSIDDHDDELYDDDENSELWDNNWEVENVVDLKESIKGWSIRGKRGRRSVLKDDDSDLKNPPSEDIDAKNLLVLADIAEAAYMNIAKTFDLEEKMIMKKRKKMKKKRLSEMEKESSSSHDHHLEVIVATEEGDGAREKHVCVTCNKSFTSYQALGGHRASHNKVKILENHQARVKNEGILLGTEATKPVLASAQGSNTSLSSSSNGEHICNICHKSFSTGQALGGHKRCHWAGPVSTEAETSALAFSTAALTTSTAAAAASFSQVTERVEEMIKPRRMVLEFDLNELPSNEEEKV